MSSSVAETPAPVLPRTAAPAPAAPVAARSSRASLARPVIFGVLALAAAWWCTRTGLHAYHYVSTEDAYVMGHLHQITSQIDGEVKEVLVDENQNVAAGAPLFRLDPLEFQIAKQKAEAAVALAKAQETQAGANATQADAAVAEVRAHVDQAEAQLAQANAQVALTRLTLSRAEQLFNHGNAATQADVDNARTADQAAGATVNAASANLAAARAAVTSSQAAQAAAHAQANAAVANTAAAEAAVREADRKLTLTTIPAPSAGRVGNRHIESGNRVLAGQAVLALAEPDMWIIANFKETQLPRVTVGQPVDFTIDALPGQELHGTIDSLSPASGAQYALLPPDNSTGNFNKVVQRIPVKIVLDAASRQAIGDRIRLGMSAVVDVKVR